MKIQTDYELLMARVESGELGLPNLVEMILNERSRNAVLVDAVREWQVLYNEQKSMGYISRALLPSFEESDAHAIADMVELILWLALPWGDNDPLFPESDGWTPQALAANVRMKQTWMRVVRGTDLSGAVPEEKGVADGNESIS
jgi:hypothetical protein